MVFVKEITPAYATRAEVSVLDRTIWATGGSAYHISSAGRIMKELKDKGYFMPALSTVSNKLFIGAFNGGYFIQAIDTKTYRVIWTLRFDNTSGFVGWALVS
jgi:outer membrane protein assembly factor BamB